MKAMLPAAAVFAAFLSLGIGQYPLPPEAILAALLEPSGTEPAAKILWTVRLPRVIVAFISGGALGAAGVALQGVFRNPLVDPHVIGVTSGAAFGGTLAILLGFPLTFLFVSAFAFGLAALFAVFAATKLLESENRLFLVLAGILLAGFFSALVSLMQYAADTEETLPNIVFWLMGSFATADWTKCALIAVAALPAGAILMLLRWRLNLLSLDDRDAASLGVPAASLRRAVCLLCAVMVAAQVAVSGSIGWTGLVVPHLARLLVGPDHRRLLPAAFWLGAFFMVIVDDVARTLTSAEIPLGILTAMIGAPIFGALLYKNRRSFV